jgi:hypothetical protein
MASENKQHNKHNQGPKEVLEYKKVSDSPIEQAKMHPFLKNAMKMSLALYIFDEAIKQLFMNQVMLVDNWPVMKMFVDMTTFALGIFVLVAVMVTPTREDERK